MQRHLADRKKIAFFQEAKFARLAGRTNDIDFRARPHSAEELDFLAAHVVGTSGPTYADLSAAPAVACVAFEPEEESPIVFLRLRRAVRTAGTRVYHLGQWSTPAVRKTRGDDIDAACGQLAGDVKDRTRAAERMAKQRTIVLKPVT